MCGQLAHSPEPVINFPLGEWPGVIGLRPLSTVATMVLLMVFHILFTAFVAGTRGGDVLLISLAYGGLLWSCASNWIPAI